MVKIQSRPELGLISFALAKKEASGGSLHGSSFSVAPVRTWEKVSSLVITGNRFVVWMVGIPEDTDFCFEN